jgi:hypothetical protein
VACYVTRQFTKKKFRADTEIPGKWNEYFIMTMVPSIIILNNTLDMPEYRSQ